MPCPHYKKISFCVSRVWHTNYIGVCMAGKKKKRENEPTGGNSKADIRVRAKARLNHGVECAGDYDCIGTLNHLGLWA